MGDDRASLNVVREDGLCVVLRLGPRSVVEVYAVEAQAEVVLEPLDEQRAV